MGNNLRLQVGEMGNNRYNQLLQDNGGASPGAILVSKQGSGPITGGDGPYRSGNCGR